MTELGPITLFLAGLLGSTHCLAMCGGIAAALGTAHAAPKRQLRLLLYQFGRIASYGTAGALAGVAGAAGMGWATTRWNDALRLATAAIVILLGLRIAFGPSRGNRWLALPERLGASLWRMLALHTRISVREGSLRALLLGLIWGWLPCGLVYSAVLAAAVSGGAAAGATDMLVFGLGTLPAMLGVSVAGFRLSRPEAPLGRLLGTIIVGCGLWTAATPMSDLLLGQTHAHHAHHVLAPAAETEADHHSMSPRLP